MSRPRQVVMLARVLPHHGIGGMQAVAWDLATALAARGVGVTVLTAAIPGRAADFVDAGVRVRALDGTSWRRYGRPWWRATRRVFEQEGLACCDLVFSVSAGGFGLLPLRARLPQVPFVLQAHGTSIGEVISKWRSGSAKAIASSVRNLAWIGKDLLAYRQFDAIVAVGEAVARDLSTWPIDRFVDRRRLHVIPNGIDTEVFAPDPAARRRVRREFDWDDALRVVVSASRLHRQKGLDLGLDAFARLAQQEPDWRYLIVGEGPELEPLQRRAAALGVAERVHFTGAVGRERIAAYLNAADVLLFTTTRVEGNPLNVLEALAVGLPVIASRHLATGAATPAGLVRVDERDAAAVAAALRDVLAARPRPRSALPRGASMRESVDAHLALFDALIASRGQHRPVGGR